MIRTYAKWLRMLLIKIQTKEYSLEQITKAFGDVIIEDVVPDDSPLKAQYSNHKVPTVSQHKFTSA
jgi:hypothetical protein